MDALKQILEKKKKEILPKEGSQKWIKQSDIEKEKTERYLEEQKKIEMEKEDKLKRKLEEHDYLYSIPQPVKKIKHEENRNSAKKEKLTENNEEEDKEPPLSKLECIKRLRALNQPITFFGEDNWQRYNRLRRHEIEQLDDVKQGVGGEGNTFQKDLKLNEDEFKQLKDVNEDEEELNLLSKLNEHTFNFNLASNQEYKTKKKIVFSEGVSVQNKCDDVYIWSKKILNEWEQMNQNVPEKDKNSAEGEQAIGIYRQCRRHLKPLFKLLKDRGLNHEILDALYHITHYCILKEYVKAHDKYLEISIGNSPWPMGVTMVGIHERSGRSKIFSSQVAHILNDETQRKYLQAIKRLMTLSQKLHPNEDPTKCVTN